MNHEDHLEATRTIAERNRNQIYGQKPSSRTLMMKCIRILKNMVEDRPLDPPAHTNTAHDTEEVRDYLTLALEGKTAQVIMERMLSAGWIEEEQQSGYNTPGHDIYVVSQALIHAAVVFDSKPRGDPYTALRIGKRGGITLVKSVPTLEEYCSSLTPPEDPDQWWVKNKYGSQYDDLTTVTDKWDLTNLCLPALRLVWACNAVTKTVQAHKTEGEATAAQGWRDRWDDPAYLENYIAKQIEASQDRADAAHHKAAQDEAAKESMMAELSVIDTGYKVPEMGPLGGVR